MEEVPFPSVPTPASPCFPTLPSHPCHREFPHAPPQQKNQLQDLLSEQRAQNSLRRRLMSMWPSRTFGQPVMETIIDTAIETNVDNLNFVSTGLPTEGFWSLWARALRPYKALQGLSSSPGHCQLQTQRGSRSCLESWTQERKRQTKPGCWILPKAWTQLPVISLFVWRNASSCYCGMPPAWYTGRPPSCPISLWSIQG